MGFWWRHSTDHYIEILASRAESVPVTIFAGADGPSDVGPPLHNELMVAVLDRVVPDDPLLGTLADSLKRESGPDAASISSVAWAIAQACGDAYLGSIVRELSRALPFRTATTRSESDDRLRLNVQRAVADRTTSQFVARAVALLAFALRHAANDVSVMSAYYDPDLVRVEQRTQAENPSFAPYRFHASGSWATRERTTDRQVPLFHMVGRSDPDGPGALVIGETSFIGDDFCSPGDTGKHGTSRVALLQQALVETTVLFVGTSLTDPGVLAALANTKHHRIPRYALVLPPKLDIAGEPGPCLARNLIAQRYLHCGVVPIMVDFPQQVPQFLRELAFRVHAGTAYESYPKRAARWWRDFGPLWGPNAQEWPTDSLAVNYQTIARGVLVDIRQSVDEALTRFAERSVGQEMADAITVELWIRNPNDRQLFRFATSRQRERRNGGRPAQRMDDYSPGSVAAKTFREGYVQHGIRADEHGVDQLVVCIPLVLDKAPWYHLPVGVVSLRSNHPQGILSRVVKNGTELGALESNVEGRLKELLEPKDLRQGANGTS
jgi:hypothetical protein